MTLLSCDPLFMQTADSLALSPCWVEPQPQWEQSLCDVCISSGRLVMVSVLGDNAVCGHLMGEKKAKRCELWSHVLTGLHPLLSRSPRFQNKPRHKGNG